MNFLHGWPFIDPNEVIHPFGDPLGGGGIPG